MGACQQQEEVLEQLQSFERKGLLETVEVNVWGKSICRESTGAQTAPGRRILDYVDEFSSWETGIEVAAEVPFEERTVSASITDEQYQKIVLPRVCLGVYAEEQLELVLPCEIDGRTFCVDDFIGSMEQQTPIEPGIGTSA